MVQLTCYQVNHNIHQKSPLERVTLVWCGLQWNHVRKLCEVFIPSLVENASSVNKIMLNNSGCAVIQWHKSTHTEQGLLVQDAERSNHNDVNLSHAEFPTHAYVTQWCKRQFYEWRVLDCSDVLSYTNVRYHFPFRPHIRVRAHTHTTWMTTSFTHYLVNIRIYTLR